MDDPDDTTLPSLPTTITTTAPMLSTASLAYGGGGGGGVGGSGGGLGGGGVGDGLGTMSSLSPSLNDIIATLASGRNVDIGSGVGLDAITTTISASSTTTATISTAVMASTLAQASTPSVTTTSTATLPTTSGEPSNSTSGSGKGGIGSTIMLQVKTLHPEVLKQLMTNALQPLIAKHKPFLAKTLTEYLVNNASPAGNLPDIPTPPLTPLHHL